MIQETLTLDELKERSLEEVLRDVVARQSTITVVLPDGQEVVIESKLHLKPLPELEGRVLEGWKDAIYGPG